MTYTLNQLSDITNVDHRTIAAHVRQKLIPATKREGEGRREGEWTVDDATVHSLMMEGYWRYVRKARRLAKKELREAKERQ